MIRSSNGIRISEENGIVLDGPLRDESHLFVSHAHADHAIKKDSEAICSESTASILEERFGVEVEKTSRDKIDLIPSGHIIGSSAALIKGEKDILYTGDVSLSDRIYIEGFEPVEADLLIMETTYGIPNYRFPEQSEVVSNIKDWINDKSNQPLYLFGYSLGKAQKIQHIVQETTDREIIAHGAVRRMNEVVEENTDLKFRAEKYGENKYLLEENAIFVGPTRTSQADFVEKLVEKYGGLKAGFSGWAVDEGFKYRGGYDKTFPLSDHCDFDELVELVEEVAPEKVYTHHGFDEAFASYLKRELGIDARALKNNQSSLTDF